VCHVDERRADPDSIARISICRRLRGGEIQSYADKAVVLDGEAAADVAARFLGSIGVLKGSQRDA